jgi:hypothetical protein
MVLVCFAVLAHGREPEGPGDWELSTVDVPLAVQDDYGEPEWWPDFEREFALYVARTAAGHKGEDAAEHPSEAAPGRKGEAAARSRPRRPHR